MSNGRQRRAEAERRRKEQMLRDQFEFEAAQRQKLDTDMMGNPVLDQNFAGMNINDGADQRNKLLNTQAGFNPSDLTDMVSDDSNDLDQLQFTTTDGAKVNIQNQRGKNEDGSAVNPTANVLDNPNIGNLQEKYSQYGADEEGNFPMSDQWNWNHAGPNKGTSIEDRINGMSMADQLLLLEKVSPNKQAQVITDFVGEDLSDTGFDGAFLAAGSMGGTEPTGYYDLEGDEAELGFDPTFLDTGSMAGTDPLSDYYLEGDEAELGFAPTFLDTGSMAGTDPLSDYSTEGPVINNAPVITQTVLEGSPEDLDLQQNPEVIGETLNDDGTVTYQLQDQSNTTQDVYAPAPGMYDNVLPGEEVALTPQDAYINTAPNLSEPTDLEIEQLEADYAAREGANQAKSDMVQEGIAFDEARGVDPLLSLSSDPFPERSDELDPMVDVTDDGQIVTGHPDVVAPITDEEVTADIAVAAKGNPQVAAVGNEAKDVVDKVIDQVKTGKVTEEGAMDQIKGLFGDLGDLLGIDAKDITRALVRYAGSRLAGFDGQDSAKFAYKGWETDSSGTTLGKNATTAERNYVAYTNQIGKINADKTLTEAQKEKQRVLANKIYKIDDKKSDSKSLKMRVTQPNGTRVLAEGRNGPNGWQVKHPKTGSWVGIEEAYGKGATGTTVGINEQTPSFAKDNRVVEGDGFEAVVPNANRVEADGSVYFDTEEWGEAGKKNHLYSAQATEGYLVLEQIMNNPESRKKVFSKLNSFTDILSKAGEAETVSMAWIKKNVQDPISQIAFLAIADQSVAKLRTETGAAYNVQELKDAIAAFPHYQDASGEVIDYKMADAKSRALRYSSTVPSGPYFNGVINKRFKPSDTLKRKLDIVRGMQSGTSTVQGSSTGNGGTPAGIDQALWDKY